VEYGFAEMGQSGMTKSNVLLYRVMSVLAIAAGCGGMVMSFLYLASASFEDITAGTSGFVAGAILIGSGLISTAMLCDRVVSDAPGPTGQSG
jgi:hypothetical protein